MTGYLLINKSAFAKASADRPENITSFQCVNHIKKIIRQATKEKIKIGHAGTLDPFATGLLIICVGRQATKKISNFLNLDKTYLVKAKLGELTDTLDKTGAIVEEEKEQTSPAISKNALEGAIRALGAEYVQTPPIYSALKHEGQPLYKLAREKSVDQSKLEEIIKSKSRVVKLYKVELLEYEPPFFTFIAHVSKGTYIRSLANDIAKLAGSCATTYELERTKIGDFSVKDAVSLDKIKTIEDIKKYLLNFVE